MHLRPRFPSLYSAAAFLVFAAVLSTLHAQQPSPQPPPETNSSRLDANGDAHITRVIPVPTDLSPEAQASLRRASPNHTETLAQRRTGTDLWQAGAGKASLALYPAHVAAATIAGIPVRNVTPLQDANPTHVLINVHGGGFDSDSGSLTESIPISNLTRTRVVSVLYRLAPEHPFPAVDDTIAVYRELLKTYQPAHIALYGTSAGAILTAQVAVRLKQLNLPLPGALGIFSGLGDFSQNGDSQAMYTLRGLDGAPPMPGKEPQSHVYIPVSVPLKDPVLSPVYANLHGMPPALFITSTRDMLLSGTTVLHRAFLQGGSDARLIVFEGLPHAFWNDVNLPESKEADTYMANFFTQQLNR